MNQTVCNKCGIVIEGTEIKKKNIKKLRLQDEVIPCLPWEVRIETRYWIGAKFDLCENCKKELLNSLKVPAENHDC